MGFIKLVWIEESINTHCLKGQVAIPWRLKLGGIMGVRNMNGYVKIGVEDEVNFVLYCLVCDTIRLKYLPRKYFTEPNINKSNINV